MFTARYRDRDVEDEARELVKEVGKGKIIIITLIEQVDSEKKTLIGQVGGGREGGSPVAQYHNGHLVNRIDFTTGQR